LRTQSLNSDWPKTNSRPCQSQQEWPPIHRHWPMTTPQPGHLRSLHHYLRIKYRPGLALTTVPVPVPAPLSRLVPAVRAVPVLMTLDQEERTQVQRGVKVQRDALPLPMLVLTPNAPEFQAAGHDVGRPRVTPNHYQGP
jgi:hypothetical protein